MLKAILVVQMIWFILQLYEWWQMVQWTNNWVDASKIRRFLLKFNEPFIFHAWKVSEEKMSFGALIEKWGAENRRIQQSDLVKCAMLTIFWAISFSNFYHT